MPPLPHPSAADRRAYLRAQGAAIMEARRKKGVSRDQAAALFGVSASTIVFWEQGRRRAPLEVKQRIIKEWKADREALGIDRHDACPCCGRPY
jgi:DNA-binding transcriptional regulator YiaG